MDITKLKPQRPLLAHRVISWQRAISVAFRAKRTLTRIYEDTD